jgi:hypothetical protein
VTLIDKRSIGTPSKTIHQSINPNSDNERAYKKKCLNWDLWGLGDVTLIIVT